MPKKTGYKRAQSALEYCLIITVAVGALLTMQGYVKRGFQGRLKKSADELGEEYSPHNMIARTVNKDLLLQINEKGEENSITTYGRSSRKENMQLGNLLKDNL